MAPSADSTFPAQQDVAINLKSPVKTTNDFQMTVLDTKTTTVNEVVKALCRDGGVVLRDFVSLDIIKKLDAECTPHLEQEEGVEGAFFPKETRNVLGITAKSRTYCTEIVAHPLWREICDVMLTTTTSAWNGDELVESVSKPQLSATGLISISPGAKKQPLHRDDMVHHQRHPAITVDQYEVGRDTSVGLFVAAKRSTRANGATRFQPGSHLEASIQPPDESKTVPAELEVGDAFVMLNSCYHGGSANMTTDQERRLYALVMTKGWLRQEENQFIAVPRETVLQYPEYVQRKLGYEMSHPYMGWVELVDPLTYIKSGKGVHEDHF